MPVYLCQSGAGKEDPWRYGIQVYGAPFPIAEGDDDGDDPVQPSSSSSNKGNHDDDSSPASDAATAGGGGGGGGSTRRGGGGALAGETTGSSPDTAGAVQGSPRNDQRQHPNHRHHNHHQVGGGGGRDLVVATWMPDVDPRQGELQRRYSQPQPASPPGTAGGGGLHHHHRHVVAHPPIRRIRHAEIVLVDDVCLAHDRYWLRLRWPGRRGGFAGYVAMGRVDEVLAAAPPGQGTSRTQ